MSRHADARETVPQPHIVGGVELRPFCLGHHLLLKALGLPFAGNAAADCGPEDVKIGLAICGLSYEDGFKAVHSGELPAIIARWRKAVSGPWWNPKQIDDSAVELAFREYLSEGYAMPPTWRYDGSGVNLSAPWEVLLKTRLLMLGLSESEILNGYLPARWYEYFTALEIEAAAGCLNYKQWKPVFFTREDAEKMNA